VPARDQSSGILAAMIGIKCAFSGPLTMLVGQRMICVRMSSQKRIYGLHA
jgi:hypothetical protein